MKSKVIISLFETVRLSVSISPRNLYNSLKSIKESNYPPSNLQLNELENVFVIHYAPNHMPDPKGEWSLKENYSELHYGIRSKVKDLFLCW